MVLLKMEKEKLFFLRVLADYMNKRPTQVPDGLDWSILEDIGQAQQLTGMYRGKVNGFNGKREYLIMILKISNIN